MILDDLGLVAALDFLGMGFAARHALEIRVHGRSEERLPGPIETVLYRIVQEALNNVAKHARAATVTIAVSRDARHVSCSVRDRRRGVRPTGDTRRRPGHRAVGHPGAPHPARRRAQHRLRPWIGTEVRVTIPLVTLTLGSFLRRIWVIARIDSP